MLRRIIVTIAAVAVSAMAGFAAYQMQQPRTPQLAAMMPSGALLYIESPDFHSLLSDWSGSAEKQAWLGSDDYAVFSRSRLFGRLRQAQEEFGRAAGVPSNMQLLDEVAGKQSAFAWYDIGKLEFLYITHLPSSSFEQSALWQARESFEQRQSNGVNFYVRTDSESKRTVAFATAGDYVVLGTREDLVANALALLGGAKLQTVSGEAWYADSVKAAKAPGDLRMVLNLTKIVPSPYFRSYWIQQNITEMKQYRAAISDLYRSGAEYREEQVLLRREPESEVAAGTDVAALAAAVPEDAGFYKAWARPEAGQVAAMLREKLLDPQPAVAMNNNYAPSVPVGQNAGSGADLDTRIDEAPAVAPGDAWARLGPAITAAQVTGVLEAESSYAQKDGVFYGVHSAVVLASPRAWNMEQVKALIADGVNAQASTSHLGAHWVSAKDYEQLDGLLRLYIKAQGRFLILANDSGLLEEIATKLREAPTANGSEVLAARFKHAQERKGFLGVVSPIDGANMRGSQDGAAHSGNETPAFFSGNIASLSRMFAGVKSESMVERDAGASVEQTVIYQWQ